MWLACSCFSYKLFMLNQQIALSLRERKGGGMEEGQEMGEMNGGTEEGKKIVHGGHFFISKLYHLIGHLQWKCNGQLLNASLNFM